jgi:hypothetical protein
LNFAALNAFEAMLDLFASQLSNLFSTTNPTLIEVAKILFISCGWIGGLIFYIKRREKQQAVKG